MDLVEPSQAKQALLLALAGFILVLPDPIPHSQSISLCPHSRTTTNDNNKRQQQTTATNDNNKQNPINPAQLDAKPSPAKHDRSQRPPPPDQSRAGVRGGRGGAATGCGPVSGLAWACEARPSFSARDPRKHGRKGTKKIGRTGNVGA